MHGPDWRWHPARLPCRTPPPRWCLPPIPPPRSIREPNYGLHGGGEEQWWALHVRPGREGQVSEGLERVVLTLPPLPPAEEGGEERPRTFSVWAPRKQIKAWNPK